MPRGGSKKGERRGGRKKGTPNKEKTATVTASVPTLIPQPNGRGALLSGGMPGNVGGAGAPPSELRAQLRGSFGNRIRVLEEFADGAMPLLQKCPKCGHEDTSAPMLITPQDRLRAIDMLAKYGLGTKDEVTLVSPDVTARLEQQARIIASRSVWNTNELLDVLSAEVWK